MSNEDMNLMHEGAQQMRRLIFLAAIASLSSGAAAREIELSTMSEAAGVYQIAFCARPTPDPDGPKPGHAFVAFSFRSASGKRDFLAVGHTIGPLVSPASAAWSYFGTPVAGYIKEEQFTSVRQKCLVAKVNGSDFNSAKALTASPLSKLGLSVDPTKPTLEAYKLAEADCISFLISVANVLKPRGLKVPVRGSTELPMQYIQRFISAN